MNKIIIFFFLLITFLILNNCNQNPYSHGKIMYENFCVNCHIEDGTGLEGNIPPLAKADFLTNHAAQLPCIIRYGIKDTIIVNGKTYSTIMDGVPQLSEVEITNIINYINHEWGNNNGYTSIKEVQKQLKECK